MLRNAESSWGWLARLLHWLGAALILFLLLHGWWMTHLAPRPDRIVNYNWHAAIGYDLLVLTVLRLLWRWLNPTPQLPGDMPAWEAIGARLVHWGLYIVTFAAALSGWALAGTFRTPMLKDSFGISFPAIVASQDRAVHGFFEQWHETLSYLLAAFVVVHVVAAFRHHFMRKSDVMRRMIWG